MKHVIRIFIIFLLLLTIISCSAPSTLNYGYLKFSIYISSDSLRTSYIPPDTDEIVITIKGDSIPEDKPIIVRFKEKGLIVKVASVPVGKKLIKAQALDNNKKVLADAKTESYVYGDEVTKVELILIAKKIDIIPVSSGSPVIENSQLAPVISKFNPLSGNAGSNITIYGSNFTGTKEDNIVRFGRIIAQIISGTSDSLTVTVPNSASTDYITISTAYGTATSSQTFTVISQIIGVSVIPPNIPVIENFTPANGLPGTTIIIKGKNFEFNISDNIVTFNQIKAEVLEASSTSLKVTVPSGYATGFISVTTKSGSTISSNFFTLSGTSSFGLSPANGVAGTKIKIADLTIPSEENFEIKFNNTSALNTSVVNGELFVIVPSGATSGFVTISTFKFQAVSKEPFTIINSPEISSISPLSGNYGTIITIMGKNFIPDVTKNIVKFNGYTAYTLSATDTVIKVQVPVSVTTGPITLSTPNGILTWPDNFILITGQPLIFNISPLQGAPNAQIIIIGKNFSSNPADNIVAFNEINAEIVSAEQEKLVVKVPVNAVDGPVSVNTALGKAISNFNFIVESGAAPIITNFTPASSTMGGIITIIGNNFRSNPFNNVVKFNGTVGAVNSATSTRLMVTIPNGATTGTITVTTPVGTTTSSTDFTVLGGVPSFISSIFPANASVNAVVNIYGNNFSSTISENIVKFRAEIATVTNSTPTSLTVNIPSNLADGFQSVTVMVNGVISNQINFNVLTDKPSISNLSPNIGSEGSKLTITGVYFSPVSEENIVKFNGLQAMPPKILDSTHLRVILPNSATTGPVTVTVGNLTNTGLFTYTVVQSGTVLGTYTPPNTSNPQGVERDKTDNMWVTSYGWNMVLKLKSDGTFINKYNVGTSPVGVKVDNNNNIWVSNAGSNNVTKLDSNGNILANYSSSGTSPGNMAINNVNAVLITNRTNNVLTKLNQAGTLIGIFPTTGSNLWGIAVDNSGNAFTTNDGNMIKVEANGTVHTPFIVGGTLKDIAVDLNNNIWIAQYSNNVVLKYSSSNNLLATYSVGAGPYGLMVDNRNYVWVANYSANKVNKINTAGTVLGPYTVGTNPVALAMDNDNNIWVINKGSNNITKLAY